MKLLDVKPYDDIKVNDIIQYLLYNDIMDMDINNDNFVNDNKWTRDQIRIIDFLIKKMELDVEVTSLFVVKLLYVLLSIYNSHNTSNNELRKIIGNYQ